VPSAPQHARRALIAAVAGNVLEWYDFAIYAYMATIIAKKFFPAGDEITSLLSTFTAFGVGFLVRPLGGILIGRLGDMRGRKAALLLTIALMTVGTVLIGVIPVYDSIGLAAPALVVLARLLQGFSAGGEWGEATAFMVEWAPPHRPGLFGSLQQCSVAGGLLLGATTAALVGHLLSPEALESWGWRVPFPLGGLLGPVGLYMRRQIDETPAFLAAREAPPALAEAPWRLAARAFGFTVVWTVSYYIVLTYMPTFLQNQAGVARSEALWYTAAGLVLLALLTPTLGHLSDRLGRKPLLLAACAACVLLPYRLLSAVVSSREPAAILLSQLGLALAIALFSGPGPAAIAEMFPTRQRSTWMSTGHSLAVAVFGGFAPFIATWLIERTGNPLAPAFYLMAAAVVSLLTIAPLRETARGPLQ
jgi:MHS family proline/betaine transporter-like MFS transporter